GVDGLEPRGDSVHCGFSSWRTSNVRQGYISVHRYGSLCGPRSSPCFGDAQLHFERQGGGELRREFRGEARGQMVVVSVYQEVADHDRALALLDVADPRDRV